MTHKRSAAWVVATLASDSAVELTHAGHSMAPCLLPGDVLTIAPVAACRTRGAILVAAQGGRLVAHRLERWRDGGVVLRGDGNRHADAQLPSAAIVGEVVSARRGGRSVRLRRSTVDRVLSLVRRAIRR